MPIQLNDLQQSNDTIAAIEYSPKFFHSKLTGKGQKIGLINESRNPKNINAAQTTLNDNINTKKREYTNNGTTVTMIPLNSVCSYLWDYMETMPAPDYSQLCKIAETKSKGEFYLDMKIHSLVLEEGSAPDKNGIYVNQKKLTPCYQIFVYQIDGKIPATKLATTVTAASYVSHLIRNTDHFYQEFTCNPLKSLKEITDKIKNAGGTIHDDAIHDYIDNYSLYQAICDRSEEWQTSMDKTLDIVFANFAKTAYKGTTPDSYVLNTLVRELRYIEDYNIPLDSYRTIYASLTKHFRPVEAATLCKQNLNLLLSDTLNNLNNNKASLNQMTVTNQNPMDLSKFSPEQVKAITSTEPLILVQAGAGTGKSTVILGRIEYMVKAGINPKDITVLSFTNAAADNITAKNPNVHSMTIARMIHNIYTENFKDHELSSIETIINSLDIYFTNDQIALDFKRRLWDIAKNEPNGFTQMNNFVEYHYDDIIRILDTLKQTCLEMEIIICYQQINNLKEPADIKSKYLIIDEVQDNSIFEFIYTLKYVDKHKESLFIVGRL